MKIGIIIGLVFGIVLIIVSGIALLVAKKNAQKCKWCPWVALAGLCAIVTAGVNALCHML